MRMIWPSKEKLDAMPKVIKMEKKMVCGEYKEEVMAEIFKIDNGKIEIYFRGVPSNEIRKKLKDGGYSFLFRHWTGTKEIEL